MSSKATLRMAIPKTTHVDNPSKERDSEEGFQRDPPSQLSEGFDGGLETEGGEFRCRRIRLRKRVEEGDGEDGVRGDRPPPLLKGFDGGGF
ncbi:hypothetical protein Bca52824_051358 [Brassica carinata]|uniref:Uncharacterized protein n=1 Tax=Brassica carinata TaxID=52824 RepID=A0A8X7R2S3_BRACI|nr:hypothetical protein Bca52824_051358 [Brassica carinata]